MTERRFSSQRTTARAKKEPVLRSSRGRTGYRCSTISAPGVIGNGPAPERPRCERLATCVPDQSPAGQVRSNGRARAGATSKAPVVVRSEVPRLPVVHDRSAERPREWLEKAGDQSNVVSKPPFENRVSESSCRNTLLISKTARAGSKRFGTKSRRAKKFFATKFLL
jgi:hypothetical protein